jgi:hypothetical protein
VSINIEFTGFRGGAGVAYTPQVDAVEEFKVTTDNYSAEYGRVLSGLVSLSLKAGTNQFDGTAFEFFQNDALNARNY